MVICCCMDYYIIHWSYYKGYRLRRSYHFSFCICSFACHSQRVLYQKQSKATKCRTSNLFTSNLCYSSIRRGGLLFFRQKTLQYRFQLCSVNSVCNSELFFGGKRRINPDRCICPKLPLFYQYQRCALHQFSHLHLGSILCTP